MNGTQFPLGSFNWEKRTTFSDASFIPVNFQWNEPKRRVHLHTNQNFQNFFGKLKTPIVSSVNVCLQEANYVSATPQRYFVFPCLFRPLLSDFYLL